MGHLDRTFYEDVQYHLELAERGVFLEYDLWGSEFSDDRFGDGLPSDKWRIDTTIELIENGHLDRILVSQDVCQKIQLTKYGGFGYAHLLDNVVPLWHEHGITKDQIREMMVENPRRLLAFEDPNPPTLQLDRSGAGEDRRDLPTALRARVVGSGQPSFLSDHNTYTLVE